MNNVRIPEPMAHWDFSKYKDEDMTESVNYVPDLTGNGYDLRLNRFDFSVNSGFEGYPLDFKLFTYDTIVEISKSKATVTIQPGRFFGVDSKVYTLKSSIVKISGVKQKLKYYYISSDDTSIRKYDFNIESDGIYILPESSIYIGTDPTKVNVGFYNGQENEPQTITVEQICPLYPFSLVFNNTSAVSKIVTSLPKESGFTLIANRKIIEYGTTQNTVLFGKRLIGTTGNNYIITEYNNVSNENPLTWFSLSYGPGTIITDSVKLDGISWVTKNSYNGEVELTVGDNDNNPDTPICIGNYQVTTPNVDADGLGHFAISEAWLFDRDLPQWQIEKFIRENATPLPEVYYDVEKQGTLNEHTTKDKLIDFSGNGNHGTLHNFTFDETNGWGYYADTNYKLEISNEKTEKLSEHKYRLKCPSYSTEGCICLLGQKIEGAFTNLKLPKIKVKVTTDSETTVGTLGLYIDGVRNFDYYYSIGNGENIIEYAPITCTESFQLLVTHGMNDAPYDIEFLPTDEDCLKFKAADNTYISLDTITEGFKTVFLEVDKGDEEDTLLYDQRYSQNDILFAIYNNDSEEHIAYQARNINGVTYINGVLNNTIKCSELTSKHLITIVNDTIKETYFMTPLLGASRFDAANNSSMKFYKFLGFKEVLSPEQIKKVIDRYNLNI